jgi:hypothetical protein
MVAVGARFVAAQEVSLSNLALKNTYLKVSAERFEISETEWTSVFTPTTVMCPGRPGTTCTARIEVTVKFAPLASSEDSNKNMRCRVIRGGILAPTVVLPAFVWIEDDIKKDHTFTWIAPGLPLGSSTISFQCIASEVFVMRVDAAQRTLTIDVYKP